MGTSWRKGKSVGTSAGWLSGAVPGDSGVMKLETSTDDLGLGTATPNEKLTVVGNVSASGNIYLSSGPVTSNAFKTISTTGQTDIAADTHSDTLTLSAMGGFEIQHHAASDRIILSGGAGSGAGASDAFKTISTSGQTDILADSSTDTLTLSSMGNFEIHHHATTDTIILSGGTATSGGGGGGGADSAKSQSTFTVVSAGSANWNSTHTTVNTNSADWSYVASNSASDFRIMMLGEIFR